MTPQPTLNTRSTILIAGLLWLPWNALAGPDTLFDAHLHFNAAHAEVLPADAAAGALERVGIVRALVSSRHDDLAEALMRAAPGAIVPFLDVYETPAQKNTWMHDPELPARVRSRLDAALPTGEWQGIGELHIAADERHSTVFRELLQIARERGLPVMIHGDPAVIDRAFEVEPEVRILWAHAGTFPYPSLVRDYLDRYPNLWVDLSMRSARLNPEGGMPLEWQDLLIEHADRFLIGADTFSAARWQDLDLHVAEIRAWLSQLPADAARRIGLDNAQALFPDPRAH
jgi:hypothetical protein